MIHYSADGTCRSCPWTAAGRATGDCRPPGAGRNGIAAGDGSFFATRLRDWIEPRRRFFDFVVCTDWSRPAWTMTSASTSALDHLDDSSAQQAVS